MAVVKALRAELFDSAVVDDVTVIVNGGGQGFCIDITETLLIKSATMGKGLRLRDVIYERPLR